MTHSSSWPPPADNQAVSAALQTALTTVRANTRLFTGELFPDDTTQHNRYVLERVDGLPAGMNISWTSSFWTGQLWLAYQLTADEAFCEAGRRHLGSFRRRLDERQQVDFHDLGFLYTLSATAAYRLTADPAARQLALDAADYLMGRYVSAAGILQAWGDLHDPQQQGRMIVDCLMNLPLLYWASRETGDPGYRAAAYSHARQSARYLLRPDHSTFHTYHFDPDTGRALHGSTAQGAAHDSCWARGQAWAMYGFTLSYVATGDPLFLQCAREVTDYFLAHLPADRVAYWDLSFQDGPEPRDSSAVAIAACALDELSKLGEVPEQAAYRLAAQDLMGALIARCVPSQADQSNALLLHGVYSIPHGVGVDEACLWGDYFYLEALTRLHQPWRPYWT